MKIFFRNIHLYLSLTAGLVIFCSCLTGTLLVFEKEINQSLNQSRYFVEPKGERLPLAELIKKTKQHSPKAKISGVMVYIDPERAVEVSAQLPDKKGGKGDKQKIAKEEPKQAKGDRGEGKDKKSKEARKPTTTIFINPYTGQVTGEFNKRESFLNTVEMFHRFLLAGKDSAGDMIVGVSTLLFLFILITGVILWWPKTVKIMRQRIKVKWDGNIKRLTHDLHIVFGFYTSAFLIIIVLGGLIMSFKWANKALFAITGSKPNTEEEAPQSAYLAGTNKIPVDYVLKSLRDKINTVAYYNIRFPKDSLGIYTINLQEEGAAENTGDTYYIDQYSGKQLGGVFFAEKSLGQRVRALVKPVHTGSVYGLPTKIISFVVCLLSLIFPVTGVMMWLNRIKKKDKRIRKKRPQAKAPALSLVK